MHSNITTEEMYPLLLPVQSNKYHHFHPLTSPFTSTKLSMPLSSRSSSATGLNLISINMLNHISSKDLDILLTIFNPL